MSLHPSFEGRTLNRICCFNENDNRARKLTAGLRSLEKDANVTCLPYIFVALCFPAHPDSLGCGVHWDVHSVIFIQGAGSAQSDLVPELLSLCRSVEILADC